MHLYPAGKAAIEFIPRRKGGKCFSMSGNPSADKAVVPKSFTYSMSGNPSADKAVVPKSFTYSMSGNPLADKAVVPKSFTYKERRLDDSS